MVADAAFAVSEGVSIKSGGDLLFDGCVGQQIARQLLDRELVEWHAGIERLDHPMAVAPCMRAPVVLLITVAVGVTGLIQPGASPAFAIMR